MIRGIAGLLVSGLLLAGCGSGESNDSADSKPRTKATAVVVESGFGQRGQYVSGVAVVQNDGAETVTANFNFLDATGEIISSESQVELMTRSDQKAAIHGFSDLGDGSVAKVASVEVSISTKRRVTENSPDLGAVDGEVYTDSYGLWSSKFRIQNPTDKPLESAQLSVACYDATGKIIGGGSGSPELVPPKGEILYDSAILNISGKPSKCTGYLSPSVLSSLS